jgi:hypothetical protein
MLNRMLRPQLFHLPFSLVGARHVVPSSPLAFSVVPARFIASSSPCTSVNAPPLRYLFSVPQPLATHLSPLPPHKKIVIPRNALTPWLDVRLLPPGAREPSLPRATPGG